jgi:hypothetical protein
MSEYLIYKILLIFIFSLAIIVFPTLLIIPAPYGRHNRPGWGSQINASLGWAIMESPAVIVFVVCFAFGDKKTGNISLLFLLMWLTHYLHRAYVYPFWRRGYQKQMPIIIMFLAFMFNTINGYLNGRYLFAFAPEYPSYWIRDLLFNMGFVLFIIGFAINLHSDGVLRALRQKGDKDYKIPHQGLFKYVSCANYFGEIVEWLGWAMATWSLPGLAFFLFTVANLLPRAYQHHKWYLREFPYYPKRRRAVIPFVF